MTVVAEFAASWPELFPRPDAASDRQNASMIKRLAESDLGGLELVDVTRRHAREWALKNPGHYRYARAMLNDAIDLGELEDNPFSGIRLNRSRGRKDMIVPELEQIEALIETAQAWPKYDGLDSMIRFAAFTGVRLGEQLALRLCDLVLPSDPAAPNIASVYEQLDPRGRRKPCKDDSGRPVMIPPQAFPIPSAALSEAETALPLWPYKRRTHNDHFREVCRQVGLHDLDWHGLRHFAATWMLNLGAMAEDVAVQLGHADGGTLVRELYGHPDPALALDRLRNLTG